jgi:energy-coupling factor transporter transmembrane protein EcfT
VIGSIRWNFIVGGLSFVITFIISIFNNIWLTTLLRSFYSFIILFAIVFLCRWVLGTIAGFNQLAVTEALHHEPAEEHKGTTLDMSTPDEDAALHQMLKGSHDNKASGGGAADFAPLNPPKLSTKPNLDAGELAQAVRHMTEE